MAWFELLKDVESTIKETLLREGIQAIPEMFSGEGVMVELEDKMGKPFPEMEVGDLAIIVGRGVNHEFNIGEEVTVTKVDNNDNSYKVENADGEKGWVWPERGEVESKITSGDVVPIGNIAVITFDIAVKSQHAPFKIKVEIYGFESLIKLSNEVTMAKEAIKLFAKLGKMDAERQNKFPEYQGMNTIISDNKIQLAWENGTVITYHISESSKRFKLVDKDGYETNWGSTQPRMLRNMSGEKLLDSVTSSIQKSWVDILKIKEEEKEIGIRSQAFKDERMNSLKKLNYYHWKEPETLKITSYKSGKMSARILYNDIDWFKVVMLEKDEVADEKPQIVLDNLKALSDANIEISDNRINISSNHSFHDIKNALLVKNSSQIVINFSRFVDELTFTIAKWGDEIDVRLKNFSVNLSSRGVLARLIDDSTGNTLTQLYINFYEDIGKIEVYRGNPMDFNLIEGNFEALEEWKEEFIKVNERAYGMAKSVIDSNSDIITWTGDNVFELGPTPLGRIYIVDMEKFDDDAMCIYPKDHTGHYCINVAPNSKLPYGDHLASLILTLINDDNERAREEIKPQGGAPYGGWIVSSEFNSIIEEIIDVRKEYFDSRYAAALRGVFAVSAADAEQWVENFRSMLTGIDIWALDDYEKELVAEKRQLSELQELIERWKARREIARQPNVSIDLTGITSIIHNHNPESGLASENKVSA
jgi:hypothetical protein